MGIGVVLNTELESFDLIAQRVSWLLSDVDGVLTDGRLYYGAGGEEIKIFNARDGLGIRLARSAGLRVGLLTARRSDALQQRCRELEVDDLIMGSEEKEGAFSDFLRRQGLSSDEVAYIGDDLPDLPVITRVGLSFAPADAIDPVRQKVDVVLETAGGCGALREAVELLLQSRGEWEDVLNRYRPSN